MMQQCWSSEPHQRGTFEEIEIQLTSMLADDFRNLPCHIYYQFVPIRDTEIGGVVKDCGLRAVNMSVPEENVAKQSAVVLNQDNQGRRFSC